MILHPDTYTRLRNDAALGVELGPRAGRMMLGLAYGLTGLFGWARRWLDG